LASKNFIVKNDIELKGNLIFEGATKDANETTLTITNPTADRTITFPDNSGTISLTSHNHTLDSLSNVVVTGTPTDGQAIVWDTDTSKWINQTVDSFPSQSGNTGKFLQTNGTSVSWAFVDLSAYLTAESDTLETVTDRGATSTNAITISNTTQATSSTTGSLIISGGVGIAKDVWIDGNLYVAGTTTTENTQTVATHDNLIYLNAAQDSVITNAVGSGTYVTYTAENDYTPGMDIRVTGMNPAGYNISSADGLTVFSATATQFVVAKTTTGTFVSGGTAHAKTEANPDLGFAGGYYNAGYAHAGLFRDASDGVFKFFEGYTPEPDEAVNIDTTHASFTLADLTANGAVFTGTVVVGGIQNNGQDITLNSSQTGTPSLNASMVVERGSSNNVAIRWNETLNMWEFTNDGIEYQGFGSGGGVEISNDPPTEALTAGLTWFQIETGRLYVYDGTFWVEASNNLNDEAVMDIVSTMVANGTHNNIEITYSDVSNSLSFNVLSEPITDFLTLNENITGTPTGNAGIIVNRGDLTDVSIRFNETEDQWEYTNDGSEYQSIGSGGGAVSTMTALSNSFWLGA
jgi:hypothetical protein